MDKRKEKNYHCRGESKEQCSSIDQEYLEGIVLEHVSPFVYLNDLCVLPGEHGCLLVRRQHLSDVGITQGLVSNKVAT